MPDEVDPQVVDSVTISNTKQLGDGPAIASNMIYQGIAQAVTMAAQNAVRDQQEMGAISRSATTVAINKLLHTQPADAVALQKLLSGSDLGQQLMSLISALSGGQQGTKVAQSTPPETAKPE